MKFLGKEIIEYYNNHFPKDHYMEETEFEKLGLTDDQELSELDPIKTYDGDLLGYVFDNDDNNDGIEFQTLLRKWLKSKTTETLILEINKKIKPELLAYLKELKGVKVIK